MAGDWIPIRINLSTDPRTVAIAARVRKHVLHTVGALSVVWGAANEHTIDGRLMGYTLDAIDSMVGIKGFAAAMESVGWMYHDDVSVTVPDFERYNSDGAKARLQGARRAARLRHAKGARSAHESNADTVTIGARKAHGKRTYRTEQNRREEQQQQLRCFCCRCCCWVRPTRGGAKAPDSGRVARPWHRRAHGVGPGRRRRHGSRHRSRGAGQRGGRWTGPVGHSAA